MRDYYTEMNEGTFRAPDAVSYPEGPWLRFSTKDFDNDTDTGWKFHVAVHPDDLPKAWNIVAETLSASLFPASAVVATPNTSERLSKAGQSGKAIAIHTTTQMGPERFSMMINQIHVKLHAAGVRPHAAPEGIRAVPGSPYLSYRNALNRDGTHVPAGPHYNKAGIKDPYASFVADPLKQPEAEQPRRIREADMPRDPTKKEFQHYEWEDVHVSGPPMVKLYIDAMAAHRVRMIGEELNAAGINYEIKMSASKGVMAIYVRGEDALNFRQIHPATPPYLKCQWKDATNTAGQKITRVPIGDMSLSSYAALVWALKDAGLSPTEHPSAELGKTLRLTGEDVDRLNQLRAAHKARMPNIPG